MKQASPFVKSSKPLGRSDQVRRKSLSSAAPKMSPKHQSASNSDYDMYNGGGDGALLDSYYYDDDSPVYFQMNSVDQMRKPRGNSTPGGSTRQSTEGNGNGVDRLQRLRFILEKKEYRETTWKYFHSFMIWKDFAFKDRPDIFHSVSVDYIRVSKAVNASISDTTMMKVWNKELEHALDVIFDKFALLKSRMAPPDAEVVREGFNRMKEHTATSRQLDRLSPMALQVMLAVNHRILWQIFCLYCDDKRSIPDPTINKAHPILRLNSTEDGEGGLGKQPMNHAHPWYSKRIVSEDALWQLLKDTRICPSQFGRRHMEKLLRDIEEEAHLEAERLRREAEESRSNPSSPKHHASRSEPAHDDEEEDEAHASGRTRSNSNRTDSADDKTVTSPDRLYPGLTPLATKPSFSEQDTHRKSRIPVKVQNSIGEGPSSSPSASVRKAKSPQAAKSTDHAPIPVLGSRSMPAVHASKQLLSFSSFVKLLWKVIAECIRMELTSDLVAAIRKIIKNKKRLRALISLVNRGQWPKFLKALHENGSRVPTGPR